MARSDRRGYIARVNRAPRVALLFACAVGTLGSQAGEQQTAEARIQAELAQHTEIEEQAALLARLAWPDEGVKDHMVACLARKALVLYGDRALPALRERILNAPSRFRVDALSALTETRLVVLAGRPADYLPALDEALWQDSVEAVRLAMYTVRPYQFFRPAMLPIIDRALEHPELLPAAIRTLAELRDDRARFFLDDQMRNGPPNGRAAAARALATIGGLALEPLRQAALDDTVEVRDLAVDALLPVTTVGDLATLFEYLGRYPSDDPARAARVKERALHLDAMLQAHEASEAATPTRRD